MWLSVSPGMASRSMLEDDFHDKYVGRFRRTFGYIYPEATEYCGHGHGAGTGNKRKSR